MTKDIKSSPRALAEEIVKILLEKKGVNVKLFDVTGKTSITDFYINVTGRSSTQVASLADNVCEKLREYGISEARIEGRRGNSWILVDYGDCILNIFDKESRDFYSFDRHLPAECEINLEYLAKAVDEKFKI